MTRDLTQTWALHLDLDVRYENLLSLQGCQIWELIVPPGISNHNSSRKLGPALKKTWTQLKKKACICVHAPQHWPIITLPHRKRPFTNSLPYLWKLGITCYQSNTVLFRCDGKNVTWLELTIFIGTHFGLFTLAFFEKIVQNSWHDILSVHYLDTVEDLRNKRENLPSTSLQAPAWERRPPKAMHWLFLIAYFIQTMQLS